MVRQLTDQRKVISMRQVIDKILDIIDYGMERFMDFLEKWLPIWMVIMIVVMLYQVITR
tara:strand:- start:415 stop:591 length:177 start_codon:yes stop_codon:yes gene_type:complete